MSLSLRILVTGGGGFIWWAGVFQPIGGSGGERCGVAKHAGNLASLTLVADHPRYRFARVDICDQANVRAVIADFGPDTIMHLAAESHVDRSIDGPGAFITTNIVGTYAMLEATLGYWRGLHAAARQPFRVLPISTGAGLGTFCSRDAFTESSA